MILFIFGHVLADETRKGNLDELENKKTILGQVQKLRNYKKNMSQQSSQIKGCIVLAGCHEAVPAFRILFNGMHGVSDREGYFSFPVDKLDERTSQLFFVKIY